MLPHYERDRIIWRSNLEPTSKLFLLALNSFMGNSETCWPGYETIAEMCGVTKRTAIAQIKKLEKLDAISVIRSTKRDTGRNSQPSNKYKINFKALGNLQGEVDDTYRVKSVHLQGEVDDTYRVKSVHLQGEVDDTYRVKSVHLQGEVDDTYRVKSVHLQGDQISPELTRELINEQSSGTNNRELTRVGADLSSSEGAETADKKKRKKKQPIGGAGDLSEFVELYNREKPEIWSKIACLTKERVAAIQKLIKEAGGKQQALVMLSNALKFATVNDWYRSRSLTFDNFAAKGKIIGLSEKWLNNSAATPLSHLKAGGHGAQTYARYVEALGLDLQEAS